MSRHRKLQPTAAERVVWSQGEATNPGGGDNLPVVETPIGNIGGLICWESECVGRLARAKSRLYADGAIRPVQEGSRNVSQHSYNWG